MNGDELLGQVRRLAREELDGTLSTDQMVPLPDGTKKSSRDLTLADIESLEIPWLRLKVFEWVGCYAAAKLGYVDLGNGMMKHIDRLTLEDAQRLELAIMARRRKLNAMLELASFLVETARDMEKLGIEVDRGRTVGDWLGED